MASTASFPMVSPRAYATSLAASWLSATAAALSAAASPASTTARSVMRRAIPLPSVPPCRWTSCPT